jgi:hypothetical protein
MPGTNLNVIVRFCLFPENYSICLIHYYEAFAFEGMSTSFSIQ